MPIPYQRKLIQRAKQLRAAATPQENHLWYDYLRDYPIRFQRQKTIDCFIADFYCFEARLIVEIDGAQHYTSQGKAYDLERSTILDRYGLRIIRFSNEEVDHSFSLVCSTIDHIVQERIR